jgi:hypothetical protein
MIYPPTSTTTTRTVVTVRDYDADETLRTEEITDVAAGRKIVTVRSFDVDGNLRHEKVTQTDTQPTVSFRYDPIPADGGPFGGSSSSSFLRGY